MSPFCKIYTVNIGLCFKNRFSTSSKQPTWLINSHTESNVNLCLLAEIDVEKKQHIR